MDDIREFEKKMKAKKIIERGSDEEDDEEENENEILKREFEKMYKNNGKLSEA